MPEIARELAAALSVWALPVLVAITFHEAAHGYVAERFGDDTARRAGRVSFNPVRHVDPVGTVALPLLLLLVSPVVFGWAKPVPVNFARLSPRRLGMALVAFAGPGMNLGLAFLAALLLHGALRTSGPTGEWTVANLQNAMFINVILALFNMLPLLPLDGGRVVHACLPRPLAALFGRTERYGLPLLIGVLVLVPLTAELLGAGINIFGWLLGGPVQYVVVLIASLAGHHP